MRRPVTWFRQALGDIKGQVAFIAQDNPAPARQVADHAALSVRYSAFVHRWGQFRSRLGQGDQPRHDQRFAGTGFISSGPRSPTPEAPYTYVTMKHFLSAFGLETLRDLPDIEALEGAWLLDKKEKDGDIRTALGLFGTELEAEEQDDA